MTADVILVVAVLVSGLLAGNELSTLIAFHPAIRRISLRSQIEAEQALTGRLGAIMPVYMILALLSAIAAAFSLVGTAEFVYALVAAIALGVMLVITLTMNVPLNKRTVEFPLDGDERAWSEIRRPWEGLHIVRVILDLVAFVSLVVALSTR